MGRDLPFECSASSDSLSADRRSLGGTTLLGSRTVGGLRGGRSPRRVLVLIVDDEPAGRSRVGALQVTQGDADLVGEGERVASAVAITSREPIDAVFLDIAMPEADGFHFVDQIQPGLIPAVVFVTAHAEHAPRAFEVDAV